MSHWQRTALSNSLLLAGVAGIFLASCASGAATAEPRGRTPEAQVTQKHRAEQLLARGRAFLQVGDTTRAIQYFNDAVRFGASESEVARPLMLAYVQSSQFRLGIQFGQDYLKRHPKDFRLRYLLGTLFSAVGQAGDALIQFREVVRLNPRFADAHYGLALTYRDHDKDVVRADFHFRQYLSLVPNGPHSEEARSELLRSVQ